MPSFCLNSTNLKGPVPTGLVRICAAGTWHGYIGEYPEASSDGSDGCGWLRCTVTSRSPLAVTLSTFEYQVLRGLARSLSSALPVNRSKVQTTSLAVKGLPSCHFTPSSSLKVRALLSGLQLHDLARSGTIVCGPFCGLFWSNSTKLFITDMIGMTVEFVAVSWIDKVGGLSR